MGAALFTEVRCMEFNINTAAFLSDEKFMPIASDAVYDVLIIGGGPAGLTAAVYAMRKGVKTALIGGDLGGQVAETAGVENYPGFRYISGMELVSRFREQVLEFSISFGDRLWVESIKPGTPHEALLSNGTSVRAKAVIAATGKRSRKLGVPGEAEFAGKGVAYCATCDAPFFAGKKVVVVGGGNSAVEAAIDLARVAEKVTVVQIMDRLTADAVLVGAMESFSNVEVLLNSEVVSINGDESVSSVSVMSAADKSVREISVEGVFVEIGLLPNTEFLKGIVDMNRLGEVKVDSSCRTSVPGLFAAGDLSEVPYKQIIIAAGEGAKAALSACDYLLKTEWI